MSINEQVEIEMLYLGKKSSQSWCNVTSKDGGKTIDDVINRKFCVVKKFL